MFLCAGQTVNKETLFVYSKTPQGAIKILSFELGYKKIKPRK